MPTGPTIQPASTLGAKAAADGVSNGAAKVSSVEKRRQNTEAEQAAAVKLPTESDTDDDAATAAGRTQQLQQNGFLQPNAAEKQGTKVDPGKEQEDEKKPAAAATGGWDASFIAKNKATLVSATAAIEQEIESRAKGASDRHLGTIGLSITECALLHKLLARFCIPSNALLLFQPMEEGSDFDSPCTKTIQVQHLATDKRSLYCRHAQSIAQPISYSSGIWLPIRRASSRRCCTPAGAQPELQLWCPSSQRRACCRHTSAITALW